MTRWKGWRRIVRADQWVIDFTGALPGMFLPAILYVSFIERGTEIRGLGVAAALASAMVSSAGPIFGGIVALSALHVLSINCTLLPEPLRPLLWRRVALVATSLFYGVFVFLWLHGIVAG